LISHSFLSFIIGVTPLSRTFAHLKISAGKDYGSQIQGISGIELASHRAGNIGQMG
jgi:hypothetical protein